MESKLKAQAMDSVGELPAGYLHLPTTPIKQEPQSDAWNDEGTKPDHPCLCETRNENWNEYLAPGYQYWNGEFWGYACEWKDQAIQQGRYKEKMFVVVQWREVQE